MVQDADRKMEKTIKSYLGQLKRIGIHVQQAILFGSYATGWNDA